jgi:hypothetical protein
LFLAAAQLAPDALAVPQARGRGAVERRVEVDRRRDEVRGLGPDEVGRRDKLRHALGEESESTKPRSATETVADAIRGDRPYTGPGARTREAELRDKRAISVGSLDALVHDADVRRFRPIQKMAESISSGDHLVIVDNGSTLAVFGKIRGKAVHGEVTKDQQPRVTVEEIVEKLSGERSPPGQSPKVLADAEAARVLSLDATANGRREYVAIPSNPVEVWADVFTEQGAQEGTLRGLGERPLDASHLFALNLVDDPATASAFRAGMPGERARTIAAEELTSKAILQAIDEASGSILLLLAHIEEGYVQAGNGKLALDPLMKAARKKGVVPIVVGCNAGVHVSGTLGDVNSIAAVQRLASALRAPDVKGLLSALATREHPLVLRGVTVNGLVETFTVSLLESVSWPEARAAEGTMTVQVRKEGGAFGVVRLDLPLGLLAVLASKASEGGPPDGGDPADGGGPDGGDADGGGASAGPAPSSGVPWGLLFGLGGVALGAGAWFSLRRSRG